MNDTGQRRIAPLDRRDNPLEVHLNFGKNLAPPLSRIAEPQMKHFCAACLVLATWFLLAPVHATGLATCDSGKRETWQPQEKLEKMLMARGWTIRRVKEDGGCYEVYALDEKGQRVEAYFHPQTLALVPTSRYPRKL